MEMEEGVTEMAVEMGIGIGEMIMVEVMTMGEIIMGIEETTMDPLKCLELQLQGGGD